MSEPWDKDRVAPRSSRQDDEPWAKDRARRDAEKRSSRTPALARSTGQGFLLGFGDELESLAAAAETGVGNIGRRLRNEPVPYSMNEARQAVLQSEREAQKRFQAEHPLQDAAAQIAGGALIPGAGWIRGANTARQAVQRAATVGAVAGAGYGAGNAEGGLVDRVPAAVAGAAVGGIAGAGVQGIANRFRPPPSGGPPRSPRPGPKSLNDLQADKNAAYRQVENSGVAYTPEAFSSLAADIRAGAEGEFLNPMRHPKAASMIEDIERLAGQEEGYSPSLTQLDQLRQVVRKHVAGAADDAEAEFGRRIIQRIDDFIDGSGAEQMVGDGGDAATLIRNARDLNTRYRKVEGVQDAVEAARLRAGSTGSGGNIDNASRQNLRRLLENTPNLTPDERSALTDIVIGTPGQNALRQIGKLSPTGNGLMGALHLGALLPTQGLSAVAGAVGAGAKALADNTTAQRIERLQQLMAAGGQRANMPEAIPAGLNRVVRIADQAAARGRKAPKVVRDYVRQAATALGSRDPFVIQLQELLVPVRAAAAEPDQEPPE